MYCAALSHEIACEAMGAYCWLEVWQEIREENASATTATPICRNELDIDDKLPPTKPLVKVWARRQLRIKNYELRIKNQESAISFPERSVLSASPGLIVEIGGIGESSGSSKVQEVPKCFGTMELWNYGTYESTNCPISPALCAPTESAGTVSEGRGFRGQGRRCGRWRRRYSRTYIRL